MGEILTPVGDGNELVDGSAVGGQEGRDLLEREELLELGVLGDNLNIELEVLDEGLDRSVSGGLSLVGGMRTACNRNKIRDLCGFVCLI